LKEKVITTRRANSEQDEKETDKTIGILKISG